MTNIDIAHAINAPKVAKSDGDYNLSSVFFITGSSGLHVHIYRYLLTLFSFMALYQMTFVLAVSFLFRRTRVIYATLLQIYSS
jgi:hypothetical protein